MWWPYRSLRHLERSCFVVIVFYWQVEWDPVCRQILAARMSDGLLPKGKIYADIREYKPSDDPQSHRFKGISGGFPCQAGAAGDSPDSFRVELPGQGVSKAGLQAGMADSRSSLIGEVFRLIDELGDQLLPNFKNW